MTQWIDNQYFAELTTADPALLCRKSYVSYDRGSQTYTATFWSENYTLNGEQQVIVPQDPSAVKPHEAFLLFAIYNVLHVENRLPVGEWISEKDLPGGAAFFRGPHEVPTNLITKTFGNDLDFFKKIAERLGGTVLDMGDAAYRLMITPEIPVAIVYWLGDEDFPAEAKLLFDRSMINLMPLDILFALVVEVCDRFRRFGR